MLSAIIMGGINGAILSICGIYIKDWRFWVLTIWVNLLWSLRSVR